MVTTVRLEGKTLPLDGVATKDTPRQLSDTIGMNVATPLHASPAICPPVDPAVMSAGHVMAGRCASVTVTVCVHVAVFPTASVTTKVFVVEPTGKADPDARPAV